MTDLGFAIVGMGIGAKKARATAETEGARLVAVCDLQEEKARAVAEELGCDHHTDLDDVLKRDDVDVVGILTPSGTHADLSMEVLEAGKHVFTTKPMDISLAKCDALIAAARKADRILAVDFGCRYDGMTRKIARFIGDGGLGKLILADLQMKWYREQSYYDGGFPLGWRSDVRYEGGSLANQGVHYIDLLMWFAGPVADVYGRSGTLGHEISTEDITMAILTFRNGAWGMVETTTCSYPRLGTDIEVTGEKGSAVWKRDGGWIQVRDQPDLKLEDLPPVPSPANIIEDMISAVREGTEVAVDGDEGRKSVELFTAVYESSRTGRKVSLG